MLASRTVLPAALLHPTLFSIMSGTRKRSGSEDADSEAYSVGDIVQVSCTSGDVRMGVVERVNPNSLVRASNGRTTEGLSLCIHNIDYETFQSDGTILQWNGSNFDELPETEFAHRLKNVNEEERNMTQYEYRIRRTINHCINESSADNYGLDGATLDTPLDELLLGESSKNLLSTLRKCGGKAAYVEICDRIGAPKNAVTLISYLNGKLCSSEIGQWNSESQEASQVARSRGMANRARGKQILDSLSSTSDDPFKQLQSYNCPGLSVFLATVSSSSYNKHAKPTQGCFSPNLFVQRRKNGGEVQLKKRMRKVVSAMSVVHNSTSNDVRLTGPGSAAVARTFDLVLGAKGGASDETLAQLAADGLVPDGRLSRDIIYDVHAAIDVNNARTLTGNGMVDATANAGDNVDWDNEHCIAVATVKIGEIPKAEYDEFVREFFRSNTTSA